MVLLLSALPLARPHEQAELPQGKPGPLSQNSLLTLTWVLLSLCTTSSGDERIPVTRSRHHVLRHWTLLAEAIYQVASSRGLSCFNGTPTQYQLLLGCLCPCEPPRNPEPEAFLDEAEAQLPCLGLSGCSQLRCEPVRVPSSRTLAKTERRFRSEDMAELRR